MAEPLRIAHYLNQFFAGIGGEEKADVGVSARPEPVGPGRALQAALGDAGRVVGTVIAGDNHVAEQEAEAVVAIRRELERLRPDALVAGLKASPWLVKPNRRELEIWAGRPLPALADVVEAAHALREQGIAHVVISLGAEGALWVNASGAWIAKPPSCEVVSTVGAGGPLRSFSVSDGGDVVTGVSGLELFATSGVALEF